MFAHLKEYYLCICFFFSFYQLVQTLNNKVYFILTRVEEINEEKYRINGNFHTSFFFYKSISQGKLCGEEERENIEDEKNVYI